MHRIFLSSTWIDLKIHRNTLLFALNKLQQKVSAMEYFGARKGAPLIECLKSVQSANIFVLIVGMRYGVVDNEHVSITQREYEKAYNDSKNILVYLIDEDEHPVYPKYIDFGEDALRLKEFKDILLERHTCDFFNSPDDLVVKVIVDLVRYLDLSDVDKDNVKNSLEKELPGFIAAGGYTIGFSREKLDLSKILRKRDSSISLNSHWLNDLLFSGYIVSNLIDDNYNILQGTLSFDGNTWDLIDLLCNHYKLNNAALSSAISKASDAIHFRMLVSLAGRLRSEECVEVICNEYVYHPELEKQMIEYGASPSTIKESIIYALSRMSINIQILR